MCDRQQGLLPLYLYRARMSLLLRIAQTADGVDALLRSDLVSALDAAFLDARPPNDVLEARARMTSHYVCSHDCMQGVAGFAEEYATPIDRYRQLSIPVLHALTAIVVNSGSNQPRAVKLVLHVVEAHLDRWVKPVLKVCHHITSHHITSHHITSGPGHAPHGVEPRGAECCDSAAVCFGRQGHRNAACRHVPAGAPPPAHAVTAVQAG